MSYIYEVQVEIVNVDYFREFGYEYIHGPVIAPDGEAPEQADYGKVVLTRRLRDAVARLNPDVSVEALNEACCAQARQTGPATAGRSTACPIQHTE